MKTIAIVDDDEKSAETSSWDVEEAGFETVVIRDQFADHLDELVKAIGDSADGALCDHRLAPKGLANFLGAELVASLYDANIPALLVTQFFQDTDVSIRKFRHKVPVLLRRDHANAESIREGLTQCLAELQGQFSDSRLPVRTLVHIAGLSDEAGEVVCDAFIRGWEPKVSIRFPKSMIPSSLQEHVGENTWFVAKANVGAHQPEDIYLFDFELAPEPADDL